MQDSKLNADKAMQDSRLKADKEMQDSKLKAEHTHAERMALIGQGIDPSTMLPFGVRPPAASASLSTTSTSVVNSTSTSTIMEFPSDLNSGNWLHLTSVLLKKFPSASALQNEMFAPSGCAHDLKQSSARSRKVCKGKFQTMNYSCGCGNVSIRLARLETVKTGRETTYWVQYKRGDVHVNESNEDVGEVTLR